MAWLLVPVALVLGVGMELGLLRAGMPSFLVIGLVIGVFAVSFAILERVSPEREDWVPFDQPLLVDAGHYLLGNQVGIGLGWGLSHALARAAHLRPVWPGGPLVVQIAVALLVSELFGYLQHRLAHRWQWLWRFHALHHRGARLNLVRAGRFHFVDVGMLTFATFFPLLLLGASELVVTTVSVISGLVGIVTHANVRVRTPRWLDHLMCTPAVHRHHHSADLRESNENYGTTLVLFDQLFGTWRAPAGPTPVATGITDDPTPEGLVAQITAPFRS